MNQNRNAACGQHKEEVLSQLRELAKREPNLDDEIEGAKSHMGFQSLVPDQNLQLGSMFTGSEYSAELTMFPAYEVKLFLLGIYLQISFLCYAALLGSVVLLFCK